MYHIEASRASLCRLSIYARWPWSYTSNTITAPHHTAYVEGGGDIYYSNGAHDWSLDVLEENANNVQLVTHDSLYLPDMTGGTIYVYAPIAI